MPVLSLPDFVSGVPTKKSIHDAYIAMQDPANTGVICVLSLCSSTGVLSQDTDTATPRSRNGAHAEQKLLHAVKEQIKGDLGGYRSILGLHVVLVQNKSPCAEFCERSIKDFVRDISALLGVKFAVRVYSHQEYNVGGRIKRKYWSPVTEYRCEPNSIGPVCHFLGEWDMGNDYLENGSSRSADEKFTTDDPVLTAEEEAAKKAEALAKLEAHLAAKAAAAKAKQEAKLALEMKRLAYALGINTATVIAPSASGEKSSVDAAAKDAEKQPLTPVTE